MLGSLHIRGRYCYTHFTDGETEARRGSNLDQGGRAGSEPQDSSSGQRPHGLVGLLPARRKDEWKIQGLADALFSERAQRSQACSPCSRDPACVHVRPRQPVVPLCMRIHSGCPEGPARFLGPSGLLPLHTQMLGVDAIDERTETGWHLLPRGCLLGLMPVVPRVLEPSEKHSSVSALLQTRWGITREAFWEGLS